jgi:hypothetical protein
MPATRDPQVVASGDNSEVHFMQRVEAWLVVIKTFTGKKTLTNAVALFLHSLWLGVVVYKGVC